MKKKLLIVITDVLSVCIAYGLALLLRFDMRYSAVPSEYIRGYLFYIILASVILVSSYTIAKLYRSVWTYAGIPEVLRTFVTSGIAAAITGVTYTISVIRMPIRKNLHFVLQKCRFFDTLYLVVNATIKG